jgi:hypothetical protein
MMDKGGQYLIPLGIIMDSVLTEVARNYTVGNSGGDRRTFSRHKWTVKVVDRCGQ